MRFLHLVNLSNGSRLSSDSGWVFARLIGDALVHLGHEFVICGPTGLPGFKHLEVAAHSTKYEARFGPDFRGIEAALQRYNPTHVLVNQPETAPAVRAAALAAGARPVIASYCHYVPFYVGPSSTVSTCPSLSDDGLQQPITLAFLSGLAGSDVAFVHSKTAYHWIRAAADFHRVALPRLEVVPPPKDDRFVASDARTSFGAGQVVYNHRLYAHYGSREFISLGRSLVRDLSLRVVVLDVLGERSSTRSNLDGSPDSARDEIRLEPGFQLIDGGDRVRYADVLRSASIALAPNRPGCTWSMSCVDALGLGLPVVAPALSWFAEFLDERMLYSTQEEAIDLVARLRGDSSFYFGSSKMAIASTLGLDSLSVAGQLIRALES